MALPALATPAEVAAFLDEDVADLPAGIDLILELASDAVRDALGQRVDRVDDDEVEVIGAGTEVLLLPELPVIAVGGVTIPGDAGDDDEELLEVDGAWRLERGRNGRYGVLRRLGGVWPRRPILVTGYDHGYALPDPEALPPVEGEVPGTIRLVVIRAAVRALFNPVGVRQESVGRYSATYAGDAGTVSVELSVGDRSTLGPFYPGSKGGRR
jgi:hypothetical protein